MVTHFNNAIEIYLSKIHFKMDAMTKVINLVKPEDWAASLDLSDAYLQVPIFQIITRYFILNQCYQWIAMRVDATCSQKLLFTNCLENECRIFNNSTFIESVKDQMGVDQARQHQCSAVYQQARRDQVSSLCSLTWK